MSNAHTLKQRKAEILRLGQEAVAQRGARRRARRHAVVMVALTAGATVLAVTLAPTRIHHEQPIAHGGGPAPARVTIQRVATTTGLADSLAASADGATIERITAGPVVRIARAEPQGPLAERVGDAEALALLREAGTPAGIIRVEDRVTLVYHEPQHSDGPSSLAPALEGFQTLAALPTAR